MVSRRIVAMFFSIVAGIAVFAFIFAPSVATATTQQYTTPIIYPDPYIEDAPHNVAAIPNSADVIVGTYNGLIVRFNPLTGSYTTVVDTQHTASYGVAVTADGDYVLSTSWTCSCLDIVRLSDAQVTTVNLPAGAGPNGVTATSDGSTAYVASQNHDVIYVVDLATPAYSGTSIAVGSAPFNVALSPDGTTLAVSNIANNYISLIDTGTLNVTSKTVDWTTTALAWSPDGLDLYVTAAGGNSLYRFGAPGLTTSTNVTVGDQPWGVAINPAGTLIATVNRGSESVALLNASDLSEITTFQFDDGIEMFNAAFSSDGKYLVMPLSGQSAVAVTQVGSFTPEPLPDTGAPDTTMSLTDLRLTALAVLGLIAVGASLVMVARRRSRVTGSD